MSIDKLERSNRRLDAAFPATPPAPSDHANLPGAAADDDQGEPQAGNASAASSRPAKTAKPADPAEPIPPDVPGGAQFVPVTPMPWP